LAIIKPWSNNPEGTMCRSLRSRTVPICLLVAASKRLTTVPPAAINVLPSLDNVAPSADCGFSFALSNTNFRASLFL